MPIPTGSASEQLAHQEAAEKTTLFARLSPAHKERVIRALRGKGHVVGFMGDGINDAPALRVADVGISVDTATDIAKESADLILLEKDLMVLEGGVTEGRKVFANILKYIRMGTTLSGSTRTIIYVMWSGISVNQCPVPGKLVMECIIETKAATILEFIQGLHVSLWVTLAPPTATPCGCGQPYFINLTCRCVAQTELVFQRALTEYRLCRKH